MEKEKKIVKSDDYNAAFFVRLACFVLVFVLIIGALSVGPFSNREATTYKNYYRSAYSYLLEEDKTIDVVCMGTSESFSGFIPNMVYEEYGYTCMNTSMTFQTTMRTYTFLMDVLKHQDIKVLVLETDMLFYDYHEQEMQSPFYEQYTSLAEPLFGCISERRFDDIISTRASVFNFNDRWKRLTPHSFVESYQPEEYYDVNHGYYFVTKKDAKVKPNEKLAVTDETMTIPYESHYYLDKIIRYCQDNGIEVVLFEFPQMRDYSYKKHNALTAAAEADGVEFIDMNTDGMLEELGIDYATDFRDSAHVNYYGAAKVSAYVSDYLNAHYGDILEDHRGDPHYAKYEEAQRAFMEKNFFDDYYALRSYYAVKHKDTNDRNTVEEDKKELDLS